jgi:pimeloyl-ACP methyl ester carboxylesterase
LLTILVLAGLSYEALMRTRDLSRHSAPGQLVDIGSHRLHIVCSGEGNAEAPVVILESGVGGWSIHWHEVQEQIATFARVCAYDRAGMGWSEMGPTPRDGQQVVNELHTLLANAGEAPPYVLVGASRGGQYARLYAATFVDEVSGLILVDAEPEEMRARSLFAQRAAAQNRGVFSVMGVAARLGIFRLLAALGGEGGDVPVIPCLSWATHLLPEEQRSLYVAVEGQPKCFRAVIAEDAANDAREAQVRAAGTLGNLPLVVLTHGAAAVPPGASTIEGADEYETVWQELQQETAALSTNSVLIVAEESGHDIMLDQPELVVESVRRVIEGNVEGSVTE